MIALVVNEVCSLGGAENMSVKLANSLVERNLQVYFVAAPGPLSKNLDKKIHLFKIKKYNTLNMINIINDLSKIIKKIKPDIIHCQGATLSILVGIALKKSSLKSINILTHHSSKFSRLPRKLSFYLLNKYCNHFIAISHSKFMSLRNGKIPANKISIIPNFIDCDLYNNYVKSVNKKKLYHELNISPDSFIVIGVGRLIYKKRFDKFIKILEQCSIKSKRKIVGIIIGIGPLQNEINNLAQNLSSKIKIITLGYQKDIYKYFAISNVFLFPTEHNEVLPMAPVEASAVGIPIVCSDIPGNRNVVVNGYNGFLIKGSIEEYCNAILRLSIDLELAKKMSINGMIRAKKLFDKKVIIDEILLLYEKLISDRIYE